MIALFAVGVVTGTILSFELGLLWPNFMATFGDVFGLAFGLEGFSFFVEAIFIAIYVYGWGRMSPRLHLLSGMPIVIAGFTGSLFVLSVNAWMNNPSGFRLEDGRAVDVEPWEALFGNTYLWHEIAHMYLAAFIVAGFLVAARLRARPAARPPRPLRAHGAGRAAHDRPLAAPVQLVVGDWVGAHRRRAAADQAGRLRGPGGDDEGGADPHPVAGTTTARSATAIEIPKLLSLLADHDPNATVRGLDEVPRDDRPPVNVVRIAFQTMVGIGTLLALLGAGACRPGAAPAAAVALVLAWRWSAAAAVGRRAAGRLGDDRGRAPAVGGLRRHAHRGGRDRRRRHPGWLRRRS